MFLGVCESAVCRCVIDETSEPRSGACVDSWSPTGPVVLDSESYPVAGAEKAQPNGSYTKKLRTRQYTQRSYKVVNK